MLIFCLPSARAENELNQNQIRFEPDPFPQALADQFLKSIIQNELFEIAAEVPAEKPSELEANIWRRNRADIFAKIRKVTIEYYRDTLPESEQAESKINKNKEIVNTFQVSAVFEGSKVTVRSDKPRYRDFLGGIRLSQNSSKGWSAILEGAQDTSILAVIPRSDASEVSSLMLCPCHERKSKSKEGEFADSAFRPTRLSFEPDAHANAAVQSGFGLGLASGAIRTSANIASGEFDSDRIVTKDPTISVAYSGPMQAQALEFSDKHQALEGVRVELDLKNGAGYKRSSLVEDSVLVTRVHPQEKIMAKLGQSERSVLAGECLLILKRARVYDKYSKEEREKAQDTPAENVDQIGMDLRELNN